MCERFAQPFLCDPLNFGFSRVFLPRLRDTLKNWGEIVDFGGKNGGGGGI